MLSYKQKQELAQKYFKEHSLSFGNSIADERAEEMYIHALSHAETTYQHTINEFKDAFLKLQTEWWDEMYKIINNKKV